MLHHSALSAQYLPLLLSLSPSLSFSIPFFSSLFAQCLTSNKQPGMATQSPEVHSSSRLQRRRSSFALEALPEPATAQ